MSSNADDPKVAQAAPLINYGAGLTKISWWTFTWTTGVGILPITIIMVTMGNNFNVSLVGLADSADYNYWDYLRY
jgi:membrane protein DedA with SNARE-associated domain